MSPRVAAEQVQREGRNFRYALRASLQCRSERTPRAEVATREDAVMARIDLMLARTDSIAELEVLRYAA